MGNKKRLRSIKQYGFEICFTFFLVTILSFVLMRISPVDPAEAYARRNMVQPTQEQIEIVRQEMGLNQPVLVQYAVWISSALRLNFGNSLISGNPVGREFMEALPFTLKLVFLSAVLQVLLILGAGSLSYFFREHMAGRLLGFLLLAGISVPSFVIAGMYIEIFAVRLNWITVIQNTGVWKYLHPAICLAVPYAAFYGRVLGTYIGEDMKEDYVFYARCRGLSETRIVLCHSLPRAVSLLVPNFMQNFGLSIAGACFIEKVFSLPGVGYVMIDSILARDAPMIHASVLLMAIVFLFTNLLSDGAKRLVGRV